MSNKELSLLRTLQYKDFYDDNKGIRCPDKLFSKDVRKIKQVLDYAMQQYERDISPSELEALFFARNPTLTTANKLVYEGLFRKLSQEEPLDKEIAHEVMSTLFRGVVGEEIASLGFDYINGNASTMEPLRRMLDYYADDFVPNFKVEWEDMSIKHLLEMNGLEAKWKFNIPSLHRRIEGVSDGQLIFIAARPNTGKTSAHASIIAAEGGFASQGAKCIVLANEEPAHRVGARYLCAAANMSMEEVKENPALAASRYEKVADNIMLKDCTGKDMNYVEMLVKAYEPDILVMDMGDKFAIRNSDKSDVYLKDAAIHARNIAKQYGCAIFWMSQLSAEAQNKVVVDMSMMEGSKTGKAAEADLMLLISRNPIVEGQEEEDNQRHITIAKNKLSGWHGVIHCELDGKRSIYRA
jgi:hypothetical protein